MQWQPIETAPKNGTEILGYRADSGILLIRWTSPGEFMTEIEIGVSELSEKDIYREGWFYADFVMGGRLEDGELPTHWMPLQDEPR